MSNLYKPEHHRYKSSKDKFHGISRIPVVDKNSIKPKFIGIKKKVVVSN